MKAPIHAVLALEHNRTCIDNSGTHFDVFGHHQLLHENLYLSLLSVAFDTSFLTYSSFATMHTPLLHACHTKLNIEFCTVYLPRQWEQC